MEWIKKGLIFDPKKNNSGWINHYAALPVAFKIDAETVRIYFSTRDEEGRSIPTYIEVDAKTPSIIKRYASKPILNLGEQGTFDDNGIMPSSIVEHKNKHLLYYIGWNPQVTVSYRLSIGLSISDDQGLTFSKFSQGPLLDRDVNEPFFNTAPFVIKDEGIFKMWYVSCTGWKNIKEWPEPLYNIKYATSKDGINWDRSNKTCIGYDSFTEAIGKPMVYKENEVYKMIYSYRSATNYRTDKSKSYRLGYAESNDGINWERKDDKLGIKFPDNGWDSIMNEYSTYYIHNNKFYLIYNGNGFGESGFGYYVRDLN